MRNIANSGSTEAKRQSLVAWLLDSDPAIRWQVMRDLTHESDDAIRKERSLVAVDGWGAALLRLQAADGHWGGAAFVPKAWVSTFDTLCLLKTLGLDPESAEAKQAIASVSEHCTWGEEFNDSPFFEGEIEPCINGRTLALGAYFGRPSETLVRRLLGEQLEDGGWNCEAPPSTRSSFNTTLCVLEGLLEYEKAVGASAELTDARHRGEQYLVERRLLRRLSTGDIVDPEWLQLSFPTWWHYDVLWALDYLRRAAFKPDERIAEAITLIEQKRDREGRWHREHIHPGPTHFEMEGGESTPSRWNTLRALRVLDWYHAAK